MVIEKDKVISEGELTKRVTEVVKGALLSDILKDVEDYKKYNAITGTTLDEEAYNKLLEEAPNYLYQLIPEGLKTYPINSEDSDESDLPDSGEINLLSSDESNLLDSEYKNDEEGTDLSDINSEVEPILQS